MDERLVTILQCRRCEGEVSLRGDDGAVCEGCGVRYAVRDGYLDLLQVEDEPDPAPPTLAQRLMESKAFVRLYERAMRPFFARVFAGPGTKVPSPAEEFALYRGWHGFDEAGEHWLDLSCGTGFFAREIRALAPKALIVGLDLSREMLRQAAEESAPADDGVAWIRGDVYSLPFADEAFDGILNAGSLHLYADPLAAYREIWRVLRPGGTYTASTFAQSSRPLGRLAASAFSVRRTDLPRLEQDLASAGFADYELRTFGDAFAFHVRKPSA